MCLDFNSITPLFCFYYFNIIGIYYMYIFID